MADRFTKTPIGPATQLAGPEAALASYLDDLLHTATETALDDTLAAPEPDVPTPTVSKLAPEAEPKAESAPAAVKKPTASAPPVMAPAKPAVVAPKPAAVPTEPVPVAIEASRPAEPAEPAPPARPDWSGAPFECLIFTVAGLQLAVPLVLLGAIHRIEDDDIRPIPGSPRWYMGIRPDEVQNLRVVDTAEWIMAGRVPDNARERYRFVIRLDNSEWGLACDDVAQSFTLKPEQVRWRTARSKRPWLAGTVVEQMCALIDVRAMADLLVRAEREHHLDLS